MSCDHEWRSATDSDRWISGVSRTPREAATGAIAHDRASRPSPHYARAGDMPSASPTWPIVTGSDHAAPSVFRPEAAEASTPSSQFPRYACLIALRHYTDIPAHRGSLPVGLVGGGRVQEPVQDLAALLAASFLSSALAGADAGESVRMNLSSAASCRGLGDASLTVPFLG
jgi:hypothetical protein